MLRYSLAPDLFAVHYLFGVLVRGAIIPTITLVRGAEVGDFSPQQFGFTTFSDPFFSLTVFSFFFIALLLLHSHESYGVMISSLCSSFLLCVAAIQGQHIAFIVPAACFILSSLCFSKSSNFLGIRNVHVYNAALIGAILTLKAPQQ